MSQCLLKFMLSNHIILYHPLLLLPSVFLNIRIFSNESAVCIRWPKYWRFSLSISPSLEYSGLIFFRIDWFDLFAVQGTLQSLFQHHSSKASILWHSVFSIVWLSHPYLAIGKTIALTRQTSAGKMMSLLLKSLSRYVIAFLPKSKCFHGASIVRGQRVSRTKRQRIAQARGWEAHDYTTTILAPLFM